VIVENDLDRRCGRVGCVEDFEELNELATAMDVLDERVPNTGNQSDTRRQGQRAVAPVLVVALRGGVDAGNRREIRHGIADRLNTGPLIIGDDGDFAPAIALRGGCRRISTSR
jgi:hypothetical protein